MGEWTPDVLFDLAQKLKNSNPRQYFKNSIGVRYVGKSDRCAMVGNYESGILILLICFFSKTDLELAEKVQNMIADKFKIHPH